MFIVKAILITAAAVVVARDVLRSFLRGILKTRDQELFLIASIFLFPGTAQIPPGMKQIG